MQDTLISIFLFQNKINHTVLKDLLDPIKELYEDVRRKALMRLEYEGLHKSEAITTPGVRFYNDPAGYAMNRYAYYVCYKCKKVWCYLLNVCYHFKSNFLKQTMCLIYGVWSRKAGKYVYRILILKINCWANDMYIES